MNYLAMTYRIVMSGAVSPRTIDSSPRDTAEHISIRGIYVSVVLTKSRANSRSVVRPCMDFHRFSRTTMFRGRRESEIVNACVARARSSVYVSKVLPLEKKLNLLERKLDA